MESVFTIGLSHEQVIDEAKETEALTATLVTRKDKKKKSVTNMKECRYISSFCSGKLSVKRWS